MRLEKKTTATLLAAVLIAIAGVMPALALESDTTTLTATVLPTLLYISVPPTVTFGEVQRDAQGQVLMEIQTGGEPPDTVDLTASLVDDVPPFYDVAPGGLTLNGQAVAGYLETGVALGVHFIDLVFTVPPDALTGSHSGTLTIYAEYTSGP